MHITGRVPINSCDFSIESYSFDETNDDFDLKDFDMNVTHDATKDGMIDMILRATEVVNRGWKQTSDKNVDLDDGSLKMFGSPWSPPTWMKIPSSKEDIKAGFEHASVMTGSAQPSCLREGTSKSSKYAKAWALYISKFITAYREYGVNLEAVTVQNEPEFPAPWEACSYTPEAEADFIGYHLGPQLDEVRSKKSSHWIRCVITLICNVKYAIKNVLILYHLLPYDWCYSYHSLFIILGSP